jgi:ABC-type bacteriocin/lantibiotic exporter with double-glycine peptidase domain
MENASGANVEGIGNILTIKSTGAQKKFGEHIAKQEHIKKEFEYSIRRVSIQQWQVYQVYNAFVMGIFLLLSGLDVVNGLLTAGSIVIINSYLVQMTNRTSEILSNYEKILEAKSGIGRMMSIFWAQDTKKTGTENFPADWKNISLEKANFVYAHVKNNTNTALTNIDLSINRYQKIGIVGKTGSGKSTLSKILVGLYPLTSGTYKIGSRNFSDISHEELSKHIAIVLQDSEMFNMTLEENITLLRKVDKELLEKAIKVAQLEEVVTFSNWLAEIKDRYKKIFVIAGNHDFFMERQPALGKNILKDHCEYLFDSEYIYEGIKFYGAPTCNLRRSK